MKFGIIILFFAISIAIADLPTFAAPFKVQANGSDIVISGSIPDPCVADLNGDGLKDLVIGQLSGGKIRLYPNSGTNADPVFTSFTYVQAGGSDITMAAG